jgi:hypothetical protein
MDAHDDFTANPSCGTRCGRAATGNASGADRLAKALTGIGTVDKSIFRLRWFHDAELRGDAGLD